MPESSTRLPAFWRSPRLPVVLAFALALLLGLIRNDFPLGYHTDEVTKVAHVRDGTNRFYHPLLLLTATRAACAFAGAAPSDQTIVRIGRAFSALMAALGVAALAAAAGLRGGRRAAWCVGLLVALSPALVLRAHFMKEDAALIGGMGLCALALAGLARHRAPAGQILLGIACALTISAKYVGLVWLPIVLVALRHPGDGREKRASARAYLPFFGALILAVLAINYPMVAHPLGAKEGMAFESSHLAGGHVGLITPRLGLARLVLLWRETGPPIFLLALAWIAWVVATWRKRSRYARLMALFPVGWLLLTHFSVVAMARYLLPAVVWMHYLAGRAVADWPSRLIPSRHAALAATTIALLAVAAWLAARTARILEQLGDDSRTRLRAWAAAYLPEGALVAYAPHAGLSPRIADPATGLDRGVRGIEVWHILGQFGSLDMLRKKTGATHVAVSALTYARYFDLRVATRPGQEEYLARPRAFYTELFQRGELVFEDPSPDWAGSFIDPPVRLYRLPDSSAPR